MRRNIKRLFSFAAASFFMACSDSSGPNNNVTGSYALITVNGAVLPVLIFFDQFSTVQITSGTVTLNSNNTFVTSATYRETRTGGQSTTLTENCNGTYTMSGNSITFTEPTVVNTNCGGVYNATWDGSNTLVVAIDATVQAVFRK